MARWGRSDGPPLTGDDEQYIPRTLRIPPARQLCHGSNRELYARPVGNKCPVCERAITVDEVLVAPRRVRLMEGDTLDLLGDAKVIDTVYLIPAHLPKREHG